MDANEDVRRALVGCPVRDERALGGERLDSSELLLEILLGESAAPAAATNNSKDDRDQK